MEWYAKYASGSQSAHISCLFILPFNLSLLFKSSTPFRASLKVLHLFLGELFVFCHISGVSEEILLILM
jgi:hypothetical protein